MTSPRAAAKETTVKHDYCLLSPMFGFGAFTDFKLTFKSGSFYIMEHVNSVAWVLAICKGFV